MVSTMTDVRRNLTIDEVSLVGSPANPKAKVALFKSEETGVADKEPDQKTLTDRLSRGFAYLAKILTGDEPVVDLSKLHAKLQERAKALPEDIQKCIAALPEEELAKEDGPALTMIEAQESLAKAQGELEEAKKKDAKGDGGDGKDAKDADKRKNPCDPEKKASDEAIMKELPEAAQKLVGNLKKAAEDQAKALEKSEARIAKLEDDTLTAELTAKVEKLEHVVAPDDRADFIKELKELPEDARTAQLARLEKANAAMGESNVFKELGTGEPALAGDAWGKIVAKAKELVGKSDSLTQEQAIEKVLVQNPELYIEYKAERAGNQPAPH